MSGLLSAASAYSGDGGSMSDAHDAHIPHVPHVSPLYIVAISAALSLGVSLVMRWTDDTHAEQKAEDYGGLKSDVEHLKSDIREIKDDVKTLLKR